MAELPKDKVSSRMEVVIPITLTGIVRGLKKICVDQPQEYLGTIASGGERLSQRMVTGRAAFPTMPLSIIVRNTARTILGSTSEEKSAWWGGFSVIAGTLGALGGWWLAGKALAGVLNAGIVGSTVGTWGAMVAAGIVTLPLALPAYGAAFIVGSLAAGALVGTLSIVPAIANIPVSIRRMIDSWNGIKHTEEILQNEKSFSQKLKDRRNANAVAAFYALPREDRDRVYKEMQRYDTAGLTAEVVIDSLNAKQQKILLATLSQRFGAATARPADADVVPAAAATTPDASGRKKAK